MTASVLGLLGDTKVISALVAAVGTVLAALISTVGRRAARIEEKIDGLRNGTYHQAMAAIAEIQREREERRIRGLPTRRAVDRITPEPAAAAVDPGEGGP